MIGVVLLNTSLSAFYVALYAADGHYWRNLAAAVFCGLMAITCAILDAAS